MGQWAGDSSFQESWDTVFQSPAAKQGLALGPPSVMYRMASPLAGLLSCRAEQGGAGGAFGPGGLDWGLAASRRRRSGPGVGRISAKAERPRPNSHPTSAVCLAGRLGAPEGLVGSFFRPQDGPWTPPSRTGSDYAPFCRIFCG